MADDISPFKAGLACRCPRCGEGRLFAGYLKLAPACTVCGLDFTGADSGDGPAVFVIFAAGAIVVALALVVDSLFHPPAFIHLALWIPTTISVSLILLRPFKATLIALQYRHKAAEHRS